jgi:hypothetical protein
MKIDYKNKKIISPEELNSQDVEYKVESTKLQFQADLLETQRVLEESKAKLKNLKSDYPLNTEAIINAQIDVESYEDGIERMKDLGRELGFIE